MKLYMPSSRLCAASMLLGLLATLSSHAETIALRPVADTSLFSSAPENNVGGNLSIAVGNTAGAAPIRGLIRFDPAAVIPAGARIVAITLQLQVVRTPILPEPATFDLHRVLVSWGEGGGGSGNSVGTGSLAGNGEATWTSRFHGAEAWSASGGAPGTDFTSAASSSADDAVAGPMTFGTTDQLVADVQAWVDNPTANFGWLIKERLEGADSTARRLASREDAARAPILTVEYVRETPLSVAAALDGNGNVCLRFTAKPGKTYKLQRREQIDAGDWTTIATRDADEAGGEASLCDPLNASAPARFYRVSEEVEIAIGSL